MRIDNSNIADYLGTDNFYIKKLYNIQPLLQNDYGEANDCTLTSLTTLLYWRYPAYTPNQIYNIVEQVASKYGYKGYKGTNPLFIKTICNISCKQMQLPCSFGSKYGKGIGYTFDFIKRQIIYHNNPVILNLWKDGNNFYHNHTVLVIGFCETKNKKLLAIYDNWYTSISYIDYDKLNLISSIVYVI